MYYAIELLRVVESLHAAGFLHADIKHDNVLLRNGGNAWRDQRAAGRVLARYVALIDFGAPSTCVSTTRVAFVGDVKTEGFGARRWEGRPGRSSATRTRWQPPCTRCCTASTCAPAKGPAGTRSAEPLSRYQGRDLWTNFFSFLNAPTARWTTCRRSGGSGARSRTTWRRRVRAQGPRVRCARRWRCTTRRKPRRAGSDASRIRRDRVRTFETRAVARRDDATTRRRDDATTPYSFVHTRVLISYDTTVVTPYCANRSVIRLFSSPSDGSCRRASRHARRLRPHPRAPSAMDGGAGEHLPSLAASATRASPPRGPAPCRRARGGGSRRAPSRNLPALGAGAGASAARLSPGAGARRSAGSVSAPPPELHHLDRG